MVFRLRDQSGGLSVDTVGTLRLMNDTNGFHYRGFDDPTVYKDDATERTIQNMANSLLIVVDYLRNRGDLEGAAKLCRVIVTKIPGSTEAVYYLADLYMDLGDSGALQGLATDPRFDTMDRVKVALARTLRQQNQISQAEIVLRGLLHDQPSSRAGFDELSRLYISQEQYSNLERLFEEWIAANPDDQQVRQLLQRLRLETTRGGQGNQPGQ